MPPLGSIHTTPPRSARVKMLEAKTKSGPFEYGVCDDGSIYTHHPATGKYYTIKPQEIILEALYAGITEPAPEQTSTHGGQ